MIYRPDHESARLSVRTLRYDGLLLVDLEGEIDMATAPRLRACLVTHAGSCGLREIEVHMKGVSFFGAAGATVLVEASAIARRHSVSMHVCSLSRPVARVLDILGIIEADMVVTDSVGAWNDLDDTRRRETSEPGEKSTLPNRSARSFAIPTQARRQRTSGSCSAEFLPVEADLD